jgi:hypothetical protein
MVVALVDEQPIRANPVEIADAQLAVERGAVRLGVERVDEVAVQLGLDRVADVNGSDAGGRPVVVALEASPEIGSVPLQAVANGLWSTA